MRYINPLVMIIIVVIIHERFQELPAEFARSDDFYKNVNVLMFDSFRLIDRHDLASYTD